MWQVSYKTAYQSLPTLTLIPILIPTIFKHDNEKELYEELRKLNNLYPDLTNIYSIGKSERGRNLWVLELSDKPGHDEIMKSKFKYVAIRVGRKFASRQAISILIVSIIF